MHYDGLADTLDGLWGGWTPSQRLEIMKDSHIGVYGVIGLVISVGLQATLYGQIIQQSIWPIIGIMTISRAVMVPVMGFLKNPQTSGLSSQVGQPKIQTIFMAMALGIIVSLLTESWAAIGGAILAAFMIAKIAKSKIGGQTGDILGATQQLAEVSALVCVAAVL
jgi:adenosylcobinamide-GDP ribazoletransferase